MSEIAGSSVSGFGGAAAREGAGALPAAGARNSRLQYLRAAAAIAVMLYHAAYYITALRGDERFASLFPAFLGGYGVAVFFALSGYLMAQLVQRDDPARFLMHRLARIYPPMLLATAAFALLFMLAGQPRAVNPLSLSLIPAGPRGYFLTVEWTLVFEMSFYVALTLIGFTGSRRYLPAIATAWLALIGASWLHDGGRPDTSLPVLSALPLSILALPFALGLLLPLAQRRGLLRPGTAWIPASAAIALAAPVAFLPHDYFRPLVGLSAALLVAAALSVPSQPPAHRLGRIGLRLGDASYVLYLCHVPVFLLLDRLAPPSLPPAALWILMTVSATLLALALGPGDMALHLWLRRRIDAAPSRRLAILTLVFIATYLAIAVGAERDMRLNESGQAQARLVLERAPPSTQPSVRGAFDLVTQAGDGSWTLRGYGIDLNAPQLAVHVAVRQAGKILIIDRMRKMRGPTARELGRPDLESQRFGFLITLPADFDCRNGPVEGLLVIEDDRVVSLPASPLVQICP